MKLFWCVRISVSGFLNLNHYKVLPNRHDSVPARMHRVKLVVETEEIQAEMEYFFFPEKQKGYTKPGHHRPSLCHGRSFVMLFSVDK